MIVHWIRHRMQCGRAQPGIIGMAAMYHAVPITPGSLHVLYTCTKVLQR